MDDSKYKRIQTLLKPDRNKIRQALNWFCIKNNNKLNKTKAVKLIFFADRYHLRKYGRLVTSEEYYAMKLGPVASKTYNMLKTLNSDEINKYTCNGEFNQDVFSESDMEALKFSLSKPAGGVDIHVPVAWGLT